MGSHGASDGNRDGGNGGCAMSMGVVGVGTLALGAAGACTCLYQPLTRAVLAWLPGCRVVMVSLTFRLELELESDSLESELSWLALICEGPGASAGMSRWC